MPPDMDDPFLAGEKRLDNVNVRMSGKMVDALDGLAALEDMNRSELICMVLEAFIEKERRRYKALDSIFGQQSASRHENSATSRNDFSVMKSTADINVRKT